MRYLAMAQFSFHHATARVITGRLQARHDARHGRQAKPWPAIEKAASSLPIAKIRGEYRAVAIFISSRLVAFHRHAYRVTPPYFHAKSLKLAGFQSAMIFFSGGKKYRLHAFRLLILKSRIQSAELGAFPAGDSFTPARLRTPSALLIANAKPYIPERALRPIQKERDARGEAPADIRHDLAAAMLVIQADSAMGHKSAKFHYKCKRAFYHAIDGRSGGRRFFCENAMSSHFYH